MSPAALLERTPTLPESAGATDVKARLDIEGIRLRDEDAPALAVVGALTYRELEQFTMRLRLWVDATPGRSDVATS